MEISVSSGLEIPVRCIGEDERAGFVDRVDFVTGYPKTEANEIGAVIDLHSGRPIYRVVLESWCRGLAV